MVPTVALPPAIPSTLQFRVVPPGALVVNCCFCCSVSAEWRGVIVLNAPPVPLVRNAAICITHQLEGLWVEVAL